MKNTARSQPTGRPPGVPLSPPLPRTAMRILVVDRDPGNLAALERALAASGHEAVWADDPVEALSIVPAVDGVIMDVFAPACMGLELARRIRAQRPDLPIVFSSGADTGPWLRAKAGRLAPVISKAWGSAELQEAVSYLASWQRRAP